MSLLRELAGRVDDWSRPFLVRGDDRLTFDAVFAEPPVDLSFVRPGQVIALIGDFDATSVQILLALIERAAVVVPLTRDVEANLDYFCEISGAEAIIRDGTIRRLDPLTAPNPLIDRLRDAGKPGLIVFSTGTTGRPKAVLHDFDAFLAKFRTPRPAFVGLTFLLFDHAGGLNTLFHMMFNGGTAVVPHERTPRAVYRDIVDHDVELLPTTPTFLRMMDMSGLFDAGPPPSLRVISYGSEPMDQATLTRLCDRLPDIDFRQTYGISELGVLRVKSRARDSLWMKVGGEGVQTRVVDNILHIYSPNRMVGYLNEADPFDSDGWYNTSDIVDVDGDWLTIRGRTVDIISVGGLKVLPSEIERAALMHPNILHAKAVGVPNPITGQHVELTCEASDPDAADVRDIRRFLAAHLPDTSVPQKVRLGRIAISHRFKIE